MPIWDTLGARYLLSLGITPREDLRAVFWDITLYEAARYYQREYGVQLSTQEIVRGIMATLEDFYVNIAPPKSGVRELLQLLDDNQIAMCVATATDRELVEPALERCGLTPYFKKIFTCGEVGRGKQEPRIYLKAAASLGTDPAQTLVFEDALYAVRTAKKAGFPVVAVRDRSESQQDQLRALASAYFVDFTQVKTLEDLTARSAG